MYFRVRILRTMKFCWKLKEWGGTSLHFESCLLQEYSEMFGELAEWIYLNILFEDDINLEFNLNIKTFMYKICLVFISVCWFFEIWKTDSKIFHVFFYQRLQSNKRASMHKVICIITLVLTELFKHQIE